MAVLCSAAFPIIGIKMIPTKNSLQPKLSVMGSIPLTKNSLSIAITTVERRRMRRAFVTTISLDDSNLLLVKSHKDVYAY